MQYTDEINELEKAILTVSDNIAEIDLQLEVNEIHADGDDDYFNWIKKAKTARFFKVKRLNRLTLELKILNKAAHSKSNKKKGTFGAMLHEESMKAKAIAKVATEKEKTERHRISESINLLMFREFKCRVKSLIGEEEYIKLIHECREKVEGA